MLKLRGFFFLSALLVLQLNQASATAATCDKVEKLSANEVFSRLYDRNQYLGIAVPDHHRLSPFDKLAEFLELRGLDPSLKTITVEDSAEIRDLYAYASVHEIDFTEFKKQAEKVYLGLNVQSKYVVENVLPRLRAINKKRASDPIIMVPVDSMNTETVLEIFRPPTDHPRFFDSIQRERLTASNFEKYVSQPYPDRKGIIIYHAAHIFKNLAAVGSDKVQETYVTEKNFLPWLEFAKKRVPQLGSSYQVVAMDYRLGKIVPSSYRLPHMLESCGVAKETAGFIWSAKGSTKDDFFLPTAFLSDYRAGTVEIIDPSKPVFDAIILER